MYFLKCNFFADTIFFIFCSDLFALKQYMLSRNKDSYVSLVFEPKFSILIFKPMYQVQTRFVRRRSTVKIRLFTQSSYEFLFFDRLGHFKLLLYGKDLHILQYIFFCIPAYGFGTTCDWVNNDNIKSFIVEMRIMYATGSLMLMESIFYRLCLLFVFFN